LLSLASEHPESMCYTAMVRTEEWKLVHRIKGQNEMYNLGDAPRGTAQPLRQSDV